MNKLEILFHELPHSKPIRQFIKSSLYRLLHLSAADTCVRVEFFRAPVAPMVECHLELIQGNRHYRHTEFGKGIHQTFQRCLKHAKGKSIA